MTTIKQAQSHIINFIGEIVHSPIDNKSKALTKYWQIIVFYIFKKHLFIYLKGRMERRRNREIKRRKQLQRSISYALIHSPNDPNTQDLTGAGKSQQPGFRSFIWVCLIGTRAKALGFPILSSLAHQQGTAWEVDQPGLKKLSYGQPVSQPVV